MKRKQTLAFGQVSPPALVIEHRLIPPRLKRGHRGRRKPLITLRLYLGRLDGLSFALAAIAAAWWVALFAAVPNRRNRHVLGRMKPRAALLLSS